MLRRKAPSTLYASNRASQNSHRLDSRAGTDANRLLRRRDGEDCAQDSSFGASEPFGSSQACNGDVHTTPAGRRGRPRADATDNQCHATSVPFRGFGGLAPGRLVHREAELLPTCSKRACSQSKPRLWQASRAFFNSSFSRSPLEYSVSTVKYDTRVHSLDDSKRLGSDKVVQDDGATAGRHRVSP